MSRRPAGGPELDGWRRAWADADDAEAGGGPAADADRVWRAVTGELPPAELRELAAAAAADPDLARAWRLARELRAASAAAAHGPRLPVRAVWRWAAAALLAIGLGLGFWLRPGVPERPAWRGATGPEIAPRTPEGAPLSRRELVLRWAPLPDPEVRYALRVTTDRLELIAAASDLVAAEYRVPESALAGLPAGTKLYWQVDARLADGRMVSSPAAVVEIRE